MLKVGPVITIAVAALVLGARSAASSSATRVAAAAARRHLPMHSRSSAPASSPRAIPAGGGGGFPGGAGGGSGTGATPGTGGGAGGGGGFGQGLIGTVSSVNGDTLTLTTRAGNVKVTVTPSTTVTKSAPGAISDLTKGTNVHVTAAGSSSGGNSSGSSVTANSIAEVPANTADAPAAAALRAAVARATERARPRGQPAPVIRLRASLRTPSSTVDREVPPCPIPTRSWSVASSRNTSPRVMSPSPRSCCRTTSSTTAHLTRST